MSNKTKLTPKKERFVAYYQIDFNATKAAIKAGYSKKTAYSQGQRLLKDVEVAALIAKSKEKLHTKLDITAERVLQEIAKIGFSNLNDFVKWGSDGVKLKDSNELTPEQAACVAEVTEATTEHGGSIRFKLHDKLSALDKLGKHLKLFTDVSEQTVEIVDESKIDEAEQKASERLKKLKGKRD